MQTVYIYHEGVNDAYPIAVFGSDGYVKARFSDEISAEKWASRQRYVVGLLSVGRG